MEIENYSKEGEIDIRELIKIVWSRRKLHLKVIVICFILGLLVVLTSRKEYTTFCRLLPEESETSQLSGLSGFANLAGINLDASSSSTLKPEIYPEIVNSLDFLKSLADSELVFENSDTTVSSFIYLKDVMNPTVGDYVLDYTILLPFTIKEMFSSENKLNLSDYELIRLTKEEFELIQDFADRISVSVESGTGIISISTEMPDPVASAQLATLLINQLTETLTQYKIEKLNRNLKFITERFTEAKSEYESKQEQLARYLARNENITNAVIKAQISRLQDEVDISYQVYKELATQLEQTKIEVKKETPVFFTLDPVRIPEEKSKPKTIVTLLMFTLLGLVGSTIYSYLKFISAQSASSKKEGANEK